MFDTLYRAFSYFNQCITFCLQDGFHVVHDSAKVSVCTVSLWNNVGPVSILVQFLVPC